MFTKNTPVFFQDDLTVFLEFIITSFSSEISSEISGVYNHFLLLELFLGFLMLSIFLSVFLTKYPLTKDISEVKTML